QGEKKLGTKFAIYPSGVCSLAKTSYFLYDSGASTELAVMERWFKVENLSYSISCYGLTHLYLLHIWSEREGLKIF
ncbi:hypothetical protein KC845_01965, partial [Candidatus Kaiserbacteria bacterium]|nr:hypothetical protein [Candidatus Kaiserbacteria bacterium]